MDQPQACTKCNNLPEDILMLACGHDLCLNCASERLNFELKKRKPANSIVCEFCYQRTPLDVESISELEKLIPSQSRVGGRSFVDNKTSSEVMGKQRNYERPSRAAEESSYSYTRADRGGYDKSKEKVGTGLSGSNSQAIVGISSKKACSDHPDEDILYFCFTCKCECICPECVIHGKHKDHDVKTIRKSHPVIKNELESSLDKIETSIENLLIKKSEVEKNIRSLNESNSQSKRQIQQAFEEIRAKLDIQEREILARCDGQLGEAIEELDRSTKGVMRRIDELKSYSAATVDYIKRDEQTMLNFYAKKWKEISEECKEQPLNVNTIALPNNEKTLTAILDLTETVERLGGPSGRHDRH